jgi:hypothetical protein
MRATFLAARPHRENELGKSAGPDIKYRSLLPI